MITRRKLLITAGITALARPMTSFPQQRKTFRIAYLSNDPSRATPTFQAFAKGLAELGWIEGKNLEIRFRSSKGRDQEYPRIAEEVVREKVDVIVTSGSPSTLAAKAATTSIPIVFGSAANPVEQKLVQSLSKPGANVTGLALMVKDLGPKRWQLLKQLLPQATRFARLYQAKSIAMIQPAIIAEDEAAARTLGVTVRQIPVMDVEDIEGAFSTAARNKIEGMHVTAASVLVVNRVLVSKLALDGRIPILGPDRRFVEGGALALASYGENFANRYRRAAYLVDKILRGTRPADIPVEQPTNYEFVVNLKVAQALGVTLSDEVRAQAELI